MTEVNMCVHYSHNKSVSNSPNIEMDSINLKNWAQDLIFFVGDEVLIKVFFCETLMSLGESQKVGRKENDHFTSYVCYQFPVFMTRCRDYEEISWQLNTFL